MPGRYLVARTGIAVYKRALDFGPFKALTRSQARLPQFPSHALRVSTAGSPSRFAGWRQGCAAVLHHACAVSPLTAQLYLSPSSRIPSEGHVSVDSVVAVAGNSVAGNSRVVVVGQLLGQRSHVVVVVAAVVAAVVVQVVVVAAIALALISFLGRRADGRRRGRRRRRGCEEETKVC